MAFVRFWWVIALMHSIRTCDLVDARKPMNEEDEDNTQRLSLYGSPLKKCDRPAALHLSGVHDEKFMHTGNARDDYCGSATDDTGTHYVCVELPSSMAPGGEVYSPFWIETGQAESPKAAVDFPKPGPWCICMWAFAKMYQRQRGFSAMVDCNATNYWVTQMYDISKKEECQVLREICSRCNLDADVKRENIRIKCKLAEKICPIQPGSDTCLARGDCAGESIESGWFTDFLMSNPGGALLSAMTTAQVSLIAAIERWVR